MMIETIEAWNHGVDRNFVDVVVSAAIGIVILALTPAKQAIPAMVTFKFRLPQRLSEQPQIPSVELTRGGKNYVPDPVQFLPPAPAGPSRHS
jgi:hypothetical protein